MCGNYEQTYQAAEGKRPHFMTDYAEAIIELRALLNALQEQLADKQYATANLTLDAMETEARKIRKWVWERRE